MGTNHIFIYGPPGSGKSSVGQVLSRNLSLEFIDLDAEIETNSGMPISQIMEEWGEEGFRDIETSALKRVARSKPRVIALGGGSLLRPQNRAFAESRGTVVFLEADLQHLVVRLANDPTIRPLLEGPLEETLFMLLERRKEHYGSFKSRVTTKGKTPEQIAKNVQLVLGRYHIRGMGPSYDVLHPAGGFDGLVELLRQSGMGGPVAIVCDENVAPLYGQRLVSILREGGHGYTHPDLIVIPAGEAHKNLETLQKLWWRFLNAGLGRKSTVIALGGGVVGDLTGFAAATFMRGVNWINIPTTLLSMVDASLGGKTGIDLPEGKNLVGAFHPPRLVLVNPFLLYTLPDAELRSGLAEVVKHGIIGDSRLFRMCSAGYEKVKANLSEVVRRGIAVKVRVIEDDPYEKGIRAALNLGHTVGHAVESVSGFSIRHGEAVSIGMVAEARLAERMGIAVEGLSARMAETLSALGLPTEIPDYLPREALIQSMFVDKKREKGTVRFALPADIGKVQVGVPISDLNVIFEGK